MKKKKNGRNPNKGKRMKKLKNLQSLRSINLWRVIMRTQKAKSNQSHQVRSDIKVANQEEAEATEDKMLNR